MKKSRRKNGNGGLLLVFLLLLFVAVGLAYLLFVKNVRLRAATDYVQNEIGKSKIANFALPTEKKSPSAAFDEIGGLPKADKDAIVLENTGYAAGYSEDLMDPLWSAYYCGPEATYPVAPREKIAFTADTRIPEAFRVTTGDYKRPTSGGPTYDRGHMAPNYAIGSRYGEKAQTETFLMTNIAPQRSSLNQQTWRYIEEEITGTYAPEFKGVWVIVGPVFVKDVSRYNKKAAMPDGFFCIVVDRKEESGELSALALYLRQNVSGNHVPREFLTTIRAIEEHTGLDFFSGLPDEEENRLETTSAGTEWHVDEAFVIRK